MNVTLSAINAPPENLELTITFVLCLFIGSFILDFM